MKTTDKKKDIEDITSHQLKKVTDAGCSILFRSLKTVDLRLFLFFVSKLCSLFNIKNRDRAIRITVKEYQELTNQKEHRRVYIQMKESLARLKSVTLNQDSFSCKLFESVTAGRGSFIIAYDEDFFKLISDEKRAFLTYIPASLFKTNLQKDDLSFFLAYKLFVHFRTRLAKKKQTANKISVASLISACPNLQASNKNRKERIIEPFKKALDKLEDIIFFWDYDTGEEETENRETKKKDEEPEDKETARKKNEEEKEKIERSYSLFKDSYIRFYFTDDIYAYLKKHKAKATHK